MGNTDAPKVSGFWNHREYLRAMVAHLRTHRRGFSYRQFSRTAGFRSPNFLKLVEQGKRNLSPESIARFAAALGLDEAERDRFETLVLFTQAATDKERNRLFEKIQRWKSDHPEQILAKDQYEAYSQWYVLPIKELVAQTPPVCEPREIARRLAPAICEKEARQALALLQKLGLIEPDGNGGLKVVNSKVSTGPGVPLAVRNYHRALLRLAAESLDGLPVEKRNITSLTVNLTESRFQEVCRRIEEFRAELLDSIEDSPATGEPQNVYMLGFQVFPVSKSNGGAR